MQTSVFQFGTAYFLQLIGIAVGTPCTLQFAICFFRRYEHNINLKYKKHLLLIKYYQDNILRIWKYKKVTLFTDLIFQECFKEINKESNLEWQLEVAENKNSVNFLDLIVEII